MRLHRYPAYATDGVTIVGAFDIGNSDPTEARLVTTTTPPPDAEPASVTGVLEIDEQGCAYLDDGTTRHFLIWTWQVQIAASSGDVPSLEDFDRQRHVASSGDSVDVDVRRLDGQQVRGGPCPTDFPPLYVTGP